MEVWLIGFVGAFTITCSVMNFDWYMNHRKAQFLVGLIGRDGARLFYAGLGSLFLFGAVVLWMQGA